MNPAFGAVDFGDEPITLGLAHTHLALDTDGSPAESPFDGWLETVGIPAAREAAENFTGRLFAPRIAIWHYDSFADIEPIRVQPLVTIDAVRYLDGDGNPQTFAGDIAFVHDRWRDATLMADWPAGSGVEIEATVGGDAPAACVSAMLLILGSMFRFRETVVDVRSTELPYGVDFLLRPYQVRRGIG